MGYPHLTPGRRLFLFLMDGGGSRTLTEICRRNADGRLLARGRKELGDLITEEEGRDADSRRPVTRIVITTRGWAAAAELRPGWTPLRRPLDALKKELRVRQMEKDPWACQFIEFEKKAGLLATLKATGWIRRPTKGWVAKKNAEIRAKGGFGSAGAYRPPAEYIQDEDRHENREPKRKMRPRGRPFPRTNSVPTPTLGPVFAPRPSAPIRVEPAAKPLTPAQPREESYTEYLDRIQNRPLASIGESYRGFDNNPKPEPRASTGETRSEVVARAKASGHFFEGAFHTTDNQVVSWQEWAAWAPK